MGKCTGFVCLCLFGDLPVIELILFELALFDSLMADEDDWLRHFDFLSRTVANGSAYSLCSGRPRESADVLWHCLCGSARRYPILSRQIGCITGEVRKDEIAVLGFVIH